MKKSSIERLSSESVIEMIGKEWMLVTAGTPENFNMMTASWGGIGFLWNKPVAFVFVRPERHTYNFIEAHERLTLSFYGEGCRDALTFCGTKSGRDYDKAKSCGLSPVATDNGSVSFAQARLTLECKKLYKGALKSQDFLSKECLDKWYNDQPGGSFHAVYVVEIENLYEGE